MRNHLEPRENTVFPALKPVLAAAAMLAAALAMPTVADAAAPTTVQVEGALHSAGGGPVADGNYDVTFAIYGAKSGGAAAWTEGPISVATSGGRFAVALGTKTKLDPAKLAALPGQWLGVKVGSDPELARSPMHSAAFALVAGNVACVGCVKGTAMGFNYAGSATKGGAADKAKDLECTGCVSVKEMKFDGSVDLGGNGLSAGKVTVSGDVQAQGIVAASKFVGDGSQLSGIKVPSGSCNVGDVMTGIDKNGKPTCAKDKAGGAVGLSNEFTDDMHGTKGKDIPDFNSNGLLDTIDVPDVGTTKSFEVTIEITKAPFVDAKPKDGKPDWDPTDLTVLLFPPTTKTLPNPRSNIVNNFLSKPSIDGNLFPHYILHAGAGAGTLNLFKVYPTKDKPVSGDLSQWVGKNPKGKWRLLILDNGDRVNHSTGKDETVDGKLVDWSIKVQTTNDKQILVKGSQFIEGKLWGKYQGNGAGDLGAPLKVGGGIQVGTTTTACTKDTKGVIRYNDTANAIEFCNGTAWSISGAFSNTRGAIYRWTRWDTYWSWGTGWYSGNRPELFGGVHPSNWSGNHYASNMSSDTKVLAGFFHRKGPSIAAEVPNSMVFTEEVPDNGSSSSSSEHVAALFRIKNTTGSAITWKVYMYITAYGGWSDRSSLALNGSNVWHSGGSNYNGNQSISVNVSIPANRTSTVIVVSSSSPSQWYRRSLNLAFYNNCLKLPTGLSFVDDLDTKKSGWQY